MKNNKVFLATTGTKKFWDLKNPNLVLAGEWCRHSTDTQSSKIRVLPYLWDDVHEVHKAQIYCNNIYEDILAQIAMLLNQYLNIDKEVKYYRIMLGNWLIHFIHQAYDKYKIFESAKRLGDIETYLIDYNDHYYLENNLEFFSLSQTHLYQLQLFSCVAECLKINGNFIDIHLPLLLKKSSKKSFSTSAKSFLKFLKYRAYKIFSRPNVVIVNPYFKKDHHALEFKLWKKSKRKILFDSFEFYSSKNSVKIDKNFRYSIKPKSVKFKDFILSLIITNIPTAYLENHKKNVQKVKNLYQNRSLKFFTYNDLYHNTQFQFFLASNYQKHKIMSAQHGGNYGMDLLHTSEEFEKSIVDLFYTYGWKESEKTRPLPMPKLNSELNWENLSNTILFVLTNKSRYIIRFCQSSQGSKTIIDNVKFPIIFLKGLKFFEHVRLRPLRQQNNNKWNIKGRIEKDFPLVKEDQNPSYYDSLSKCRLAVFDHFGTPFLESMQANVPSIVFINKSSYLFRKEFTPFVEKMIQEKILFYNPEEAAIHVNQNYNDILEWWKGDSLQKLVQDFVRLHAYTTEDWMDIWCEEFLNDN